MNWPALMAFGLGTLRLPPDSFWSLTPRELTAIARATGGPVAAPLDRAALAELRARYPDIPDDP